jgi:site-specific recombinase XerD
VFTYPTNQFPYKDESASNASTANTCGDTSLYGSLRKEIAMANLIKRREVWYARVRWTDKNHREVEKQIPLKTGKKSTAQLRIAEVKNVEDAIKLGLDYSFPWLCESAIITKVKYFTLTDAVSEWMNKREKGKIRESTLELNELGLRHFIDCLGRNRPLRNIDDKDIENYVEYLESRGNSDNTINMQLRTIKAMFRHYLRVRKLKSIPIIDQITIPYKEPIYITDNEFQSIMELKWLDSFYKRQFLLYRETGMRLREPFISSLNGDWIDIPPESKTHAKRSMELTDPLREICVELMEWKMNGYGSNLLDPGEHLSKKFKKAMRFIGAVEIKRFHSLRHTFAVRKLLVGVSIYELKLLMGHKSVTTTETYSNMNLRRVRQDFPTIGQSFAKTPDFTGLGHGWRDTRRKSPVFHDS